MQDLESIPKASWYLFWNAFFEFTKINNWLEINITNVNPAVLSPAKSIELLQATIRNSNYLSIGYLEQTRKDAQRILSEVPYPIPFEQIQGILISQDESKLIFKTINTELYTWNEKRYIIENEWFFSKKNDNWFLVQNDSDARSIENEEDSINWKINFYRYAFNLQQTPCTYKEEEWTQIVDQVLDNYKNIQFKHIISSEVNHLLIAQHIQPQLAMLTQRDVNTFSSFYQRQSPESGVS